MEDGGLMSWYLGINVIFNKNGSISFDQHQYLQEKLEEFKEFIGNGGAATALPQITRNCWNQQPNYLLIDISPIVKW
jgi:hypothetical protein